MILGSDVEEDSVKKKSKLKMKKDGFQVVTKDGNEVEPHAETKVHGKDLTKAFQYPLEGGSGMLTVYEEDLLRLSDGSWLNDNCMDLFIQKMIVDKNIAEVYVMPANFYHLTVQKGHRQSILESMSRWLNIEDLKKCNFLAIPITAFSHWSLFVIENPMEKELRKVSLIDSLGSYHDYDAISKEIIM